MYYKGSLYISDVSILKKYTDVRYKLISFKRPVRQKGFEIGKVKRFKKKKNDSKLENNISRAKQKVFEYAICNNWDYFITLTLNPKKYDRTDLKKYKMDLSQWIRDYKKKYNAEIKYLLIPELHKDLKAWHMHGFINGIPPGHITNFIPGKHPMKLIEAGYKNWSEYSKKFGHVSLGKIKDKEKAASYIRKYVNKDMDKSVKEYGAHMYYCSQGLKKSVEIKRGTLNQNVPAEFENDYIKITWLNDKKDALNLFY